jgi:diguanylate cyclase (GGDEF)-like protein/putative nucleotidyltransferase with HDIG domain
MEASHATDCAHWKAAVDPVAATACSGAIETLADFPVLDATVQRVIALCDDENATTADLVGELEADPSFSANLLRFANSELHAHPIRAKSIRQAVMLIGRRSLRRLALEAATFRFLERARGNGGAACGDLHVHAVAVATCAAAAAKSAGSRGESVHLAALLHDVGKLVLPAAFGAADCDAIAASHPAGAERVRAERARFGIDHAQAGALLCLAWKLPEDVASAVAWHHGGTSGIGVPDRSVACIQLADGVAAMLAGREPDHSLLEAALAAARLQPAVLDELAAAAVPDAPRGDELARRLRDRDRLGGEDRLTQLPDRSHWLRAAKAAIAEHPAGSIAIMDIDRLGAINVAHGTRVGDYVLTQLARAVVPHGIAGRLGGDEIALFTEMTPSGARELAESIARHVAEGFADLEGARVQVSAGVAGTPEHGRDLVTLLEAAEADLRAAKTAAAERGLQAA